MNWQMLDGHGVPVHSELVCAPRLDEDPLRPGRRIYFDNAGGAFRLKSALEEFYRLDSMPDCPERVHRTATYMNDLMAKAEDDIRTIFNAKKGGRIITMLTASQVMVFGKPCSCTLCCNYRNRELCMLAGSYGHSEYRP